MRSPAPACVRRGAVRRYLALARLVGGAVPRRGGGGLLPCGHGLVRILPAQSALVLELLQGKFLRGGRCWCVRGAHPVGRPVRRELGKLSREGHQLGPFGFKLRVGCGGHGRTNGRACSLVHASAVRVCTVPVRGPGMAMCFLYGVVRLRTPYRGGVYGQNLYWSLCATFSACVRAVRCSAWAPRAVYLVCVRVYVRRSACAAQALYHSS